MVKKCQSCTGCGACATICPHDAIQMEEDREGFLYPIVDKRKCVSCSLCESVCQCEEADRQLFSVNECYAMKAEEHIRRTSQSGGAFYLLANEFIKNSGVVYGVIYDALNRKALHKRIDKSEDLKLLVGSKYIQSEIGTAYYEIGLDLKQGKKVLFSGTPCQVYGLRKYTDQLRINTEALYCIDIVCHGAPSPSIFQKCVSYYEKKYHEKIVDCKFRDKKFPWGEHKETYITQSGKQITEQLFTKLFYEHLILRPSCHSCHFASADRIGDISLGDFWGVDEKRKHLRDDLGVSIVLINNLKGKKLFEWIQGTVQYESVTIEEAVAKQSTMIDGPSRPWGNRELFWDNVIYHGIEYAAGEIGFCEKKNWSKGRAMIERIKVHLIKIKNKEESLLDIVRIGFDIFRSVYYFVKGKCIKVKVNSRKYKLEQYRKEMYNEDNFKRKDKIYLEIHLTEACNLNCKYCDNFSPLAKKEFITFEELEKNVKRLSEVFKEEEIGALRLPGGEPLLYPDIENAFAIIRKYLPNVEVYIITNGLLLNNQKESFWRACNQYNIGIRPTKYPIKFDYEKAESTAKKFGVFYQYYNNAEVLKKMHQIPLDLKGKQDSEMAFRYCYHANGNCSVLKNGKIYQCNTCGSIEYFNKEFSKNLKTCAKDYIDLFEVESSNEVFEFLCHPTPFCRYCKTAYPVKEYDWEQSKKDITEWV